MSTIVTFYSFKGGVGRSMALANVAVLLVRQGLRVLAVDWDLEAPGLDLYFKEFTIRSDPQQRGLLDLLIDASKTTERPDWRRYLSKVAIDREQELLLLTSGRRDDTYAGKVLDFNWTTFFQHSDGGRFIESLREDWLKEYDVTLIDSRTGITDSGGICTIQLPDVLVLVFTTNEQSLNGAKDVALSAQKGRQRLAFDRMPLLVFPLLSRFEGRVQFLEGKEWLSTAAAVLVPFYNDWLPTPYTPLQILERTKLPYIGYFSFGERLPVTIGGTSDREGLGFAYSIAADLIGNEFRNVDHLLAHDPQLADLSPPSWLTRWRAWIGYVSRPPMLTTLSFIGAGIAALAVAGWTVYQYLSKPDVALTSSVSVSSKGSAPAVDANATVDILATPSINLSAEQFQRLVEEIGVSKRALTSLFKSLELKDVPLENLDHTLREVAKRYRDLQKHVDHIKAADPVVAVLLDQARDALALGELDRGWRSLTRPVPRMRQPRKQFRAMLTNGCS